MKVGDTVRHRRKGWIGKILEISSRGPGIMVDLSDKSGVMCRVVHRDSLEVISESR
jgi:hypothetical protein